MRVQLDKNTRDIQDGKLDEFKQDIIGAIYDAVDIDIPTCFIILDRDLDKNATKEKQVCKHMKDDAVRNR